MKLVIQIPCLNEETTLPLVLNTIPKKIPGIDDIEILVIDDGSTDKTVEVAKAHGVKHFVHHTRNQGLGQSFHDGIIKSLELGADIVVNTDGDNQYPQAMIGELIQPILDGRADITIGDRQTQTIAHFSASKKLLQRFGSWVINKAAGTDLPDAASGFRAYDRASLLKLNTITRFSYCMETIIQAGNKRLAIVSIPIITNAHTRESRLFTSVRSYVWNSGAAIVRAYVMYRPLGVFMTTGTILFVPGIFLFTRFFYFLAVDIRGGGGVHHIQSLIVGSVLLIASFVVYSLGILADLIRINRILIEDDLEYAKAARFKR
jgi:glycosyltransferase involved in cell wall biosynthesis